MRNSYRSSAMKYIAPLLFLLISSSAYSSDLNDFGCGGPKVTDYDYEQNELGTAIAADFMREEYKVIVDSAILWKRQNCTFKSGKAQIDYWLSGFTKAYKILGWERALAQIEKFKAAYPKSDLPALAESRYWSDYAYNARGSGYASMVTPEGWRLFKERLEKSHAILIDIKKTAVEWPQWYWQMIRVQSLLQRPHELVTKTFYDGVKKHPNTLAIYTEMAYYMEPRWGGSWEAVDKITTFATQHIVRESKDATYARMYWATADIAFPKEDFYSETKASWTRMKKGFVDLINSYPNSTLLRNNFLKFACNFEDKSTYIKYRKTLTKHDIRAWSLEKLNSCDAFMSYVEK